MNFFDLCIKRPVLATVLSLVVVLLGLIGYQRLSVREYPKIDEPIVSVSTGYKGASPEVIESQITKTLEDSLSGIEGVSLITSNSRSERSDITVTFKITKDPDVGAAEVRDKVARVRARLPESADEPVIAKVEADSFPVMWFALTSETHNSLQLSDAVNRLIKPRLLVLPGAADLRIFGERKTSMRIFVEPAKLAAYRLTVADVENALRAQNVEIPAGRIESRLREFNVLAQTDLQSPEEFGAIVIAQSGGYPIRIRDVAKVEVAAAEERGFQRFMGKTAVGFGIIRQSTGNPLELSKAAIAEIPRIQESLPKGMKIELNYDSSVFIAQSIKAVFSTIGEAVILVALVIFFFLRSLRATIIPLVTIPVALTGAFFIMYAFGFTINTLTLLAMVLAIGLVVDDAIVMLENIYRHVEEGMPPFEAALRGSKEIGFAIVAMTLTLAAVYLPLAFSTGRTGKLFVEFALTLAGAVLVSGFTALTLSPMMSSKLLRHQDKPGRFYLAGERMLGAIDRGYRRLLERLLAWRWIIVGAAAAVFAAAAFLWTGLPRELAPQEDQGFIIGFGIAPEGSTVEYTDKYARQMEAQFRQLPDLQRQFQIVGFPSITTTIGFVMLKDWEQRKVSTPEVQGQLFPQFMGIPGIMAFPTLPPPLGQDGFGQPVSFVVQSTGTWDELGDTMQKLMAKMRENPNLTNPDSDLKLDKPQLKIDVDRDKVAAVGSDVATVGHTLETMLGGRNVTRFKRGSEQYDVIVQVEDADRRTPGDLDSIFVRAGDGQMVQLSNLVGVRETVAAKELNHFNKLRSATISAGLAPGYSMGEALSWMESALKEVAPGAQYDLSGQSREFRESAGDFGLIFALAIAFIFLVLAAQFESWVDPLVILLAVPLAMFGAFLALKLAGGSWNIYSQIGVVTLVGLIAKHGILIVEFANQLQEQGRTKLQAVIDAAALRLRPILMTTGAMVLGALPLALAAGAGAEARNQIGWVIVGGMGIGTVFTLFVVPVMYLLIGRDHHRRQAEAQAAAAHPAAG